jgi:AraC-like DNA-binding protein
MEGIIELKTVNDYCERFFSSALHPLVTTLNLSELTRRSQDHVEALSFGFYAVFLKQGQNCVIKYGRKTYDYQDGTLVFVGPGQSVQISNDGPSYVPSGHALLFHPDLLLGTDLGKRMDEYGFFSYNLSEALHLSRKERHIVLDCLDKIQFELEQGLDKHSKNLIVSNLELFLNYCSRFYDRQFISRDNANPRLVEQFDEALKSYFETGLAVEKGVPAVGYFANKMHFSSNYFGDLIKKETGRSAQEYIQEKLIDQAKAAIVEGHKSVSEIAYELGFKYPQHFTRLFKKKVGCTPNEFRVSR